MCPAAATVRTCCSAPGDRTPFNKDSQMLIAQIANDAAHITHTGIGLGAAIAVVCSWQRNRSIGYAIVAGILSWIYVIYFACTRTADETSEKLA